MAAALGALGAGLASMALGSGRGEGQAARLALEETRLMGGLIAAVDRDAEAYVGYLEARAGRGDLVHAVERSIAVPLDIAEQALAALESLLAGVGAIRPRLSSEGVTAAWALRAAVEGATSTADANLAGLLDAGVRERRRAELESLRTRAEHLLGALCASLRGGA